MTKTAAEHGVGAHDAGAFLGLPPEASSPARAAAAVLPVPYDETSSYVKGADRGPAAILQASRAVELYDVETASEPWRRGVTTLPALAFHGDPVELARRVAKEVGAILDRRQLPIVLGGEHSVSIGAIDAAADRFADLTVLQIDAHADTREEYEGSTHNHACVMARARERCAIVQVGIRSVDAAEMPKLERDRVLFAHEIAGRAGAQRRAWIDRVVEKLTDDVYVTIDLDAFDPSVVPATGTPEPGGLTWYEVTDLLAAVTSRRKVVAFDVVELCPMEGQHASAFTAAKLVYRLLAMAWRQG